MKRLVLTVALTVLPAVPVFAQASPGGSPPDGPPAAVRQRMEDARAGARSAAMKALSADHQAKVDSVTNDVKAGRLTDVHVAAQKIDAILSGSEAHAVLDARDKMMSDMRGAMADRPRGDGPPPGPGGPGGDNNPGGPPGSMGPPPMAMGPDGPGRPGGPSEGPPHGPGPGFGSRSDRRALHNDAGFALLMLSLDHDQARTVMMQH